jgi:hypothetical protein
VISEEKRAYNRAYYEANRERLIEAQKVRYAEDRERIRAQRNAHLEAHRDEINARARERHRLNPEVKRESVRRWRAVNDMRLREHGLTKDEYDALVTKQENACAICRNPFFVTPRIDHDHATDRVRGLLCHNCNVALGHFRDDPSLMQQAIRYLEDPK